MLSLHPGQASSLSEEARAGLKAVSDGGSGSKQEEKEANPGDLRANPPRPTQNE